MSEAVPLRVGTVPYLNARPLVFGFRQGLAADRVRLETHVPSELALRLAGGLLDVALLSSVELARIPGLAVLPGLAIGSAGPVRSVVLVSKVAPESVRTFAPDPESRTSNALAAVLLRGVWGASADEGAEPRSGELDDALAEADAAVRIGDKALHEPAPPGTRAIDLGEAWTAWTGLPFVYAVWAAREGAVDRAAYEAFHASHRRGLAVLDAIADDHEWRGRRDPSAARAYLAEAVRYRLGEPEVRGLRRFLSLASSSGLVPRAPEVRLLRFADTACDAVAPGRPR